MWILRWWVGSRRFEREFHADKWVLEGSRAVREVVRDGCFLAICEYNNDFVTCHAESLNPSRLVYMGLFFFETSVQVGLTVTLRCAQRSPVFDPRVEPAVCWQQLP